MRLGILLATALGLLLACTTLAQPKKAAAGDFKKLIKQWEAVIREVRDIQVKYRLAEEGDRDKLKKAFHEKMTLAKKMMPQVVAAGEAAYKADPRDKQLRNFMLQLAEGTWAMRDDCEAVQRITNLLITNIKTFEKDSQAQLYTWAAIAAYELGNVEEAEKHLKAAADAGDTDNAKKLREDVEKEKGYWAEEQKARANDAKTKTLPKVRIKTSRGDIVVLLFENEAPNTVANFMHLVQDGYYNGKTFHRVLPGFVIQGGAAKPDGSGGPGWQIPCECYGDKSRRHFRGSLSMAHAGRDTGGAQFFICLSRFGRPPQRTGVAHLDRKLTEEGEPDGGHTVFGRVIEGLETMALIQRRTPSQDLEADRIISATVEFAPKDKKYTPKKVGDEKKEKEKKKDGAKKNDKKPKAK